MLQVQFHWPWNCLDKTGFPPVMEFVGKKGNLKRGFPSHRKAWNLSVLHVNMNTLSNDCDRHSRLKADKSNQSEVTHLEDAP